MNELRPLFAALESPNAVVTDFYKFMGKALNTEPSKVQSLPKNFQGNRFSGQGLEASANKFMTFDKLANGDTQYPQSEHGIVSAIRVYSGIDTGGIDKVVWQPGVVDPDIINGSFDVKMNGNNVMTNIPMKYFQRTEEENSWAGYLTLLSPIPWLAQTNLSIEFEAPVAVAAANTFLFFEIQGPALTS